MTLLGALKWMGTAAGILGAVVLALNLPFSGWGYALFLASSTAWTVAGWWMREGSIVALQGAFTGINILGVYRWLLV